MTDTTAETRKSRRISKKEKKKKGTDKPAPSDVEVVPWELPGYQMRISDRRSRSGFYGLSLPGAPTTTKQAEILNAANIGAPTGTEGIVLGRDNLSRTAISHDPITAYNHVPRLVSSPNVINAGDVGAGKSSNTKCNYVLRPLTLSKRRAVVFDKKDQEGEGEYANVARAFGAEPIKFTMDGNGTRLNLLDPLIARGGGIAGQTELLNTVVRLARDGQQLNEWEEEALRAALGLTLQQKDEGRAAVVADVLPNLGKVADHPDYADMTATAHEKLHESGLSVRFALNSLMQNYSSLLDGETSKNVDLTGKLTSFDISQLPEEGPAVPVVMAIGNSWLVGRLREDRGWATNCIYEEGWHVIAGPTAYLARSNQKLSRGLALSNIINIHKGSDIPADSPGMAMIQEAQTVHVYRQSRPEDARWCQETFGFDPSTVDQIQKLRDGEQFFKLGTQPETRMTHYRSPWETSLTNTDGAFEAAAGNR